MASSPEDLALDERDLTEKTGWKGAICWDFHNKGAEDFEQGPQDEPLSSEEVIPEEMPMSIMLQGEMDEAIEEAGLLLNVRNKRKLSVAELSDVENPGLKRQKQ
jgi:hypothetical protein